MGTLVWTETFESYLAGALMVSPWTASNGGCTASAAQAHGGTQSVAVGINGTSTNCYRAFGSNLSQWYADFWMWTNASGGTTNQFVSFPSATTLGGVGAPSVNVGQTGAGRCGPSNGTPWFTFSVSLSTWHHYLFEVLSAAAGTAKLTVDGAVVGTYSGDTRDNGATAYAAYAYGVGAGIGPSPPAEFYVDDLSIYSGVVVGGASQARAVVMA